MKPILILAFTVFISFFGNTQESQVCKVTFAFLINEAPLELGKPIFSTILHDSITIDKLKLYVSFNQSAFSDSTYFLLDASKPLSLTHDVLINTKPKKISFTLGVDSITNSDGARGGDLDPMHGMYWSWQSGYINFKFEGSSVFEGNHKKFIYHLGGYDGNFNSLQSVSLKPKFESATYELRVSLDKLLQKFDYSKNNTIMSPSLGAVELSKIVAKSFYLFE